MNSTPTIRLLAATLTFLPVTIWGQAVDPSVPSFDPSVKARVQDPDHPDSPLSPGARGRWMREQPTSTATAVPAGPAQPGYRPGQFPSLTGRSSWIGASRGALAAGNEAASLQTSGVVEGRSPTLNASRLGTKLTGARKQMLILAGVELEQARSSRSTDEYSAEQEPSDLNAKLRMLKQAAQKSARLRVTNPFQNKADAANAGRWRGTVLTAGSLEQQRHQETQLLARGYGTPDQRHRYHHHRKSASSAGSR